MPSPTVYVSNIQELGKIAFVSLRAARIVMETGGRAHVIAETARTIAAQLGVCQSGLRIGYRSLAITVSNEDQTITRMIDVEHHSVNHRLNQAVCQLAQRTSTEHMPADYLAAQLDKAVRTTPVHPPLLTAAAVGLACASFGRVLGVDWLAFAPVLLASSAGQLIRRHLLSRGMNVFVVVSIVAFACSMLSTEGARMAGSTTVNQAMISSALLLVPGVPATNAQADIMDGHPTLGSARVVNVTMLMVFVTVGIWTAGLLLGVRP